jgi:hypothetical protein
VSTAIKGFMKFKEDWFEFAMIATVMGHLLLPMPACEHRDTHHLIFGGIGAAALAIKWVLKLF